MSKLTVSVWGNVTSEPMHVVGPSGTPRTTFRLAHTPRKRLPDGGFGNGVTSFFNVTCFGYVAVNVAASVHKGDPVVLFGEMTVREWSEGGRSGREVDLVAQEIGPNLRWGRARFERPPRGRRGEAPPEHSGAGESQPPQESGSRPDSTVTGAGQAA